MTSDDIHALRDLYESGILFETSCDELDLTPADRVEAKNMWEMWEYEDDR
jgi:hypothetical protein